MPVLEHRRNDIYSLSLTSRVDSTEQESYLFSDKIVPASAVFYRTKFSYAFTNIRCVVPGRKTFPKNGESFILKFVFLKMCWCLQYEWRRG